MALTVSDRGARPSIYKGVPQPLRDARKEQTRNSFGFKEGENMINPETGNPYGAGVLKVYSPEQAMNGVAQAKTPGVTAKKSSGGGGGGRRSSGGGGGGGGAAPAAALAAPVAIPNLSDYVNQSFLLKSIDGENGRKMADFDAESRAGEEDTRADQALRSTLLRQNMEEQGQANAESFASRGLGRSGLVFQEQDKIDKVGEVQRNGINQLLTDFTRGRQSSRAQQEAENRQARLNAIQQLTDSFNTQYNTAQTL